jgi:hypothetical protein
MGAGGWGTGGDEEILTWSGNILLEDIWAFLRNLGIQSFQQPSSLAQILSIRTDREKRHIPPILIQSHAFQHKLLVPNSPQVLNPFIHSFNHLPTGNGKAQFIDQSHKSIFIM